jgi:hypothetical protein
VGERSSKEIREIMTNKDISQIRHTLSCPVSHAEVLINNEISPIQEGTPNTKDQIDHKKGEKMDPKNKIDEVYKKLTFYLFQDRQQVFNSILESLKLKYRINITTELLEGLVEQNLPHYVTTDLDFWKEVRDAREEIKKEALSFLKQNELFLLNLILSHEVDDKSKERLLFLLGKYSKDFA